MTLFDDFKKRTNKNNVRYFIEHIFIRDMLYERPTQLLNSIIEKKAGMFGIWDEVMQENNVKNPYAPEQFTKEVLKYNNDIYALIVQLPEPEEVPLCHRVYLIFDTDGDRVSYFTVEKGSEGPVLCTWHYDMHMQCEGLESGEYDGELKGREIINVCQRHARKYGLSLDMEEG